MADRRQCRERETDALPSRCAEEHYIGAESFHVVRGLAEEPFGAPVPFERHRTRFPGSVRIVKAQAVAQVLNELEPELHGAGEARREIGAHR